MKKKLVRFLVNPLSSVIALGVSVAGSVNAAVVPSAPVLVTSYASVNTNIFCPVINVMFWILISVSIIMVLWAAYLYVTSEGDNEKPSQARKMILYACIGIVIALLAKGVPSIVGNIFGFSPGGNYLSCP